MEIIIILSCCVGALAIFYLVKFISNQLKKPKKPKKEKTKKRKSKIAPQETIVKNVHLTVKSPYMMRKEVLFWKYLNLILPKQYIVVPKVSLVDLFIPDGDKSIFRLIADKTLDYVIFNEQNMSVALVIDIYDKSYSDEQLEEQDPFLLEILSKLNIKVLSLMVASDFDRDLAKDKILSALGINTSNASATASEKV